MQANQKAWIGRKRAQAAVAKLESHGFDAHFYEDTQAASTAVLEMVASCETFGFGGSDTTRELGLTAALREKGKTVYDHWMTGISAAKDLELRLAQGRCDCFFCSANAIAMTGEIVNVDGVGNRTNAMTFGPRKVMIVAGVNKLAADLHAALKRVRETAAPMRARSLKMETPCAKTGVCSDCNTPQRICRVTTILHRRPMLTDISVVLINTSLGF